MLTFKDIIEIIEPKVNKGIINKYVNTSRKRKLVYTSFDGDYMNFLPHMLKYTKDRGYIPINPESTLGYYISTTTYNGEKPKVMCDCIQAELLCDEMWAFNPTNGHIPEGVLSEMLVWIKNKNKGLAIIPFFETTNLTISPNSSRSLECFNKDVKEIEELISRRDKKDIEEIREKLFNKVDVREKESAFIVANFFNYKHIDWTRVYCYKNNYLPISPQNIIPFSLYTNNEVGDYLESRLTLLDKCDRLFYFTNTANYKFELANLDTFACTELYYWYTRKNKDMMEIVEWKDADVPKYSNYKKWALTSKEVAEVTGAQEEKINIYKKIRQAIECYEDEIKNEYNIFKGNLLNDEIKSFLINDKNAFIFGLISDQSVKAELAWSLPYQLKQRLGAFNIEEIANMDVSIIEKHIKEKPSLHRYPLNIAKYLQSAARRIIEIYDGNAENIWSHGETAEKIVERLEEFKGISHKKAALGCLLLVRDLNVNIADKENINLAYDIHIRRICMRTGLCKIDTLEEITNFGKLVFPEFPGRLTSTFWAIGRDICRPTNPMCLHCPINEHCMKNVELGMNINA